MENIQIISTCPWISEKVDVATYFDEYHKVLDEASGLNAHNEEINMSKAMRNFFHAPEDLAFLSKRSTPTSKRTATGEIKQSVQVPTTSTCSNPPSISPLDDEDSQEDLFSVDELERSCSVDLLTVEGELPSHRLSENDSADNAARITNWYTGSYMDGVIPDGSAEILSTLAVQEKELYKREAVKDYSRLRLRSLKYTSTVRMAMKDDELEDVNLKGDCSKSCLRDVIMNVRVQRPFFKKLNNFKAQKKFPKHSQEMLMLGRQTLSQLKDAIICINDHYVHSDMSENPDPTLLQDLSSSKLLFPSGHFYINGSFFYDDRPNAADITSTIRKWALKTANIGPMDVKKMTNTNLTELNIRLGYPYLYQHLGNCEHLVTFTDIRLVSRSDIQDFSRYPLSRGNPVRLTASCSACSIYKACWIVKDHPGLPQPLTHFCDRCLKYFCYTKAMKKREEFKLYPYVDEFSALRRMHDERQNVEGSNKITILLKDSHQVYFQPESILGL